MSKNLVFLKDYNKKILKDKRTNDRDDIILTKEDKMEAYNMILDDDDEFIDSFLKEYVKKEM